jgi:hypothetical protein
MMGHTEIQITPRANLSSLKGIILSIFGLKVTFSKKKKKKKRKRKKKVIFIFRSCNSAITFFFGRDLWNNGTTFFQKTYILNSTNWTHFNDSLYLRLLLVVVVVVVVIVVVVVVIVIHHHPLATIIIHHHPSSAITITIQHHITYPVIAHLGLLKMTFHHQQQC